tara:strand:- start:787 stop:1050 length:264 start_codon:yes stop_codon:yes gene_type:complete
MSPINNRAIQFVFNNDLEGVQNLTIDEIKRPDENGRTAIHAACFKGYSQLLTIMLQKLGDESKTVCDTRDNTGRTAVHYACGEQWEQ